MRPLKWEDGKLFLLDQRVLPHQKKYIRCQTLEDCHQAIQTMAVRGAPLIGFSAMWGVLLWLLENKSKDLKKFDERCDFLISARPTAVNLAWEVSRCRELVHTHHKRHHTTEGVERKLEDFIISQMEKLAADNLTMATLANGELGRLYGNRPLRLMTLCNTGVLACGAGGTALGVVAYLHQQNRLELAYVSETRPWLQGARLSAFELSEQGIAHKVVVEGASSYLMREKLIDAIFIGADRIALNGDTANKIGSSSLAIVAKYYDIPFYVVAPTSSFDKEIESGAQIPIELRAEEEILKHQGEFISPKKSRALNPGFDITEGHLITGILCEKGLIRPPHLKEVLQS